MNSLTSLYVEVDNKEYTIGQLDKGKTVEEVFTVLDFIYLGKNEDQAREVLARWEGEE